MKRTRVRTSTGQLRVVEVRQLYCPTCEIIDLQAHVEERGAALWRITCSAGHSWDCFPEPQP